MDSAQTKASYQEQDKQREREITDQPRKELSKSSRNIGSEQPPKIFTKHFFINAFVNLMLYVNYYVLMVAMAGYCFVTYNADTATAGFAASIFIVGALFARFLGGGIIDFFGRKICLIVGTLVMTLCAASYLFEAGLGVLFALRILHGFAYGISQTAISSIATEAVPKERKGEGVGYFMLSATLGSAVGPFMGTVVSEYLNYTILFTLCAGVIALGFLLSFFVHEPHVKKSSDKSTLHRVKHANISLSSFIEIRALPISCSVALAILAYGAVITYLDSFASEQDMVQAASLFFVVYSIVMFVARPFTGKAFDKNGDFGVMIAGFCSFALGMVCMGFAHNGIVLLIAACFLGFGVGTINPCGLTLAVQKSPAFRLTTANSTYSCLCDATIGLAPVLLGWSIPLIDYNGLYLVLTAVVLIAMGLYALLRFKKLI